MSRGYGSSILNNEFHSDIVHEGVDKCFHIRYVAAFQLTGVMRFIVADPNGTAGKDVDRRLRNEISDAFAQRKPLNFIAFFGVFVFAIVLDQEFQRFPVADTRNLVELSAFRLKGLIEDLHELWGQGFDILLKFLRGKKIRCAVIKLRNHLRIVWASISEVSDKGTKTVHTGIKNC